MKKIEKIKHWGFPIGVSILCYLLLLILFSPVKLEYNDSGKKKNKIIMLPLDGNHTPFEQDLISWLKDNDPTLIVMPSRKFNYSRALIDDFNFKLITNNFAGKSSIDLLNDNAVFKSIRISPVPLNSIYQLDDIISNYERYYYNCLPENTFKLPVENVSYPVFSNFYTGKIYSYKFPSDIKIKDRIKKLNPQKSTVLNVNFPLNIIAFPEVKIISSSGEKELDTLAADNVITQTPMKMAEKNAGKNIKLVIQWK